MAKPCLHVRVLFHPRSDSARELARSVFARLTGSPRQPGIRIPVSYAPERDDDLPPRTIDVDLAAHTLLVFLADRRMSRRVAGGTGVEWGELLADQILAAPPESSHCALPVALDGGAFELSDRLDQRSFVRLDVIGRELREEELFFQIAVRALQMLQGRSTDAMPGAGAPARAPCKLFVSHAKGDLPKDPERLPAGERSGPVYELLAQLARGPVDAWYDAKKIPPGGRFDEEIRRGVLDSSALVCVVTDQYSTREWCRREALEAKEAGRPMVVVDALEEQEARRFPYLGNVPTIRWRDAPGMARRVVILAVGEALRYAHALESLRGRAEDGDHVLACAPELLTVSAAHGARRVLCPDLPLGSEERQVLARVLRTVELTTPWSRMVGRLDAGRPVCVGLSLSAATDARRYGASADHLGIVADDLSVMLLLAGARLAYGGRLGHQGAGGDEDYTARLFEHVRGFHPRAREAFERRFHPLVNYAGWPIHRAFTDAEYALFGQEAELIALGAPEPLGVEPSLLEPDERGYFPPASEDAEQLAARRFAWGRGMTAMRERMDADLDARVSVGGNLERFVGQLPGVVEECLLALERGKPLYLIGALGGATRLVVDGLEVRQRSEFTLGWARRVNPAYDEVAELYRSSGLPCPAPPEIGARLAELGAEGPARALGNGLSDAENRDLFTTTDPFRMVELILTGLANLRPAAED